MESARFRVERSVSFPLYDFLESILRIWRSHGGGKEWTKKNRKLSHPLISTRDETFPRRKNVTILVHDSLLPSAAIINLRG